MSAFNVNMDEVVKFTAKLERLNRSAFPIAVRQTLNDAAFKTKELVPKVAAQKFTTRQRNFFRAFSTVQKASGYDVNRMVAIAGINEAKGSEVAEGLEKQETGGTIRGRKLIPHDKGRVSQSRSKKLRTKHRFRNISIATTGNRQAGSKYILIKKGSRGTVFEINPKRTSRRLTPVYIYRRSRNSKVPKSPFMAPSAMFAASKMNQFYVKNAEYQFNRALK